MELDTREIASITFGVYSNEEILKLSVAEINNTKLNGEAGSVYDGRMGVIENGGKVCLTCNMTAKFCNGHQGHIQLNEPILHPLFYKEIRDYLASFCIKCFRLLLTPEQIQLNGFSKIKTKLFLKDKKVEECGHCDSPQPDFKYSPTDNSISMIYKQKGLNKISIVLSVDEIRNTFNHIIDEDLLLIDCNPKLVHPKNFIMSVFPVLPPCSRPFVIADGNYCDDDLTNQILEIIKANNHLAKDDVIMSETKRQKYLQSLKFRITTFYNNSSGKAKHSTSGRKIKGLKERLTGKSGQIRNNLMGKRCLDPNTPILLWSGNIKKAKEIKIGDVLIGDDGEKRTVLKLFSGNDTMYKIVPENDGVESYIVNSEHILSLKFEGKEVVDMSIEEYLLLNSVTQKKFIGFKLEESIKWDEKPTSSRDPYVIGMSLGNPCELNFKKRIPEQILHNCTKVRLELLAGIIDVNGKVENNGTVIKIIEDENQTQFIKDLQFLTSSLGFRNEISSFENKITITIKGKYLGSVPTLLQITKCKNTDDDLVSPLYSFHIVCIGHGDFNGFQVSGNGRFLLGDFTVTHNCDQTGRTVIGPDPTLKMGQLGLPIEMAQILTIPVQVNNFNIEHMTHLVNEGHANYVIKKGGKVKINLNYALFKKGTDLIYGDEIHRSVNGKTSIITVKTGKEILKEGDMIKRNGNFLENIIYPQRRTYTLEPGDIVERKLQNGDIVLLNRQPTLHAGSMLAQEIIIMPHKTLRFNLSIAKSFNADFDGDEMNIHVPQSLEAQAELRYLSASKFKMISAQSSKPNYCIVQDSLLASYKMTLGKQILRKDQFFDISLKTHLTVPQILEKIQHIRRILKLKSKPIQAFTGKGLFSLILPNDLLYEKKNNANPEEPIVKIYKGVLYEGTFDKTILGATHNSLIQIMYKEYGVDKATQFIDNVQFITNAWLTIHSFTIGLQDCLVQGKKQLEEIEDIIEKCYIEAERIKTTTNHAGVREIRITSALSKAKDIGLRIAKESLAKDNNFLSTVKSGSKGDWFNISQITGVLGQQNLLGQRVKPLLNNGQRTLPHYPFDKLPLEMEYESRGFIASSFIKGMNPKEFYFHMMSGRESVCDTAMGTSRSGYIQRRIIKLTEDIKTQYDGTVRDATGKIYQMAYGEDNLDPCQTVKVNSNQELCDIGRLIAKLNLKHESKT
jgi:DNA-directed RNA polymerase beta' subunit